MSLLPLVLKEKARLLRRRGYSLNEIARNLSISKSTASLWLRNVTLPHGAIKRLERKKILGQYKTILLRKKLREKKAKVLEKGARNILNKLVVKQDLAKLLCALLYYCEGTKGTDTLVTFINSDPTLVSLFLSLFRKAFTIDESKFRVLMHLHDYHSEKQQKEFWSKLTLISKKQFYKTYRKLNTKKRIRESYQGCVSIRYYSAIIAKELLALYKVASQKYSE